MISDAWIRRSPSRVDNELLTDETTLALAKDRRVRNALLDRCINDTKAGTHGPLVDDGVRCAHCVQVHRHGAVLAAQLPEYVELPRAS